jgi:hypothetical protein
LCYFVANMADNGGTFGIDKIDRVVELPDGSVAPVAPPNRGRLRFNASASAWEYSINGQIWTPFTGPGGSGRQLVFDPLGVGPSGAGVFSDWDELYAAFQQTPGVVQVAFVSDATIPAGAYDFESRASLLGPALPIGAASTYIVTLDAGGVTLSNISYVSNIELRQAGVGPAVVLGDDEILVLYQNGRLSSSNGPLVRLESSGGNSQVIGVFGGVVSDSGGAPVIEVASGKVGGFVSFLQSGIANDTVIGDATATFVFYTDSVSQNAAPSFAGFAGSVFPVYASASLITAYSATTPADWGGSSPATVSEALDRIAAALGPIP